MTVETPLSVPSLRHLATNSRTSALKATLALVQPKCCSITFPFNFYHSVCLLYGSLLHQQQHQTPLSLSRDRFLASLPGLAQPCHVEEGANDEQRWQWCQDRVSAFLSASDSLGSLLHQGMCTSVGSGDPGR